MKNKLINLRINEEQYNKLKELDINLSDYLRKQIDKLITDNEIVKTEFDKSVKTNNECKDNFVKTECKDKKLIRDKDGSWVWTER